MDIVVFIEEKFNIKMPDTDIIPKNFNTINKIIELINRIQQK
jgi:acyl carrier protein